MLSIAKFEMVSRMLTTSLGTMAFVSQNVMAETDELCHGQNLMLYLNAELTFSNF